MVSNKKQASKSSTILEADVGPVTRHSFNPQTGCHEVKAVHTEKFIKGPLPLNWFISAQGLPGKAGAIGLAIWYLVGLQNSRTIKVNAQVEKVAGCSRKGLYAALVALEEAGLISVVRKAGARPTVTVLNCPQTAQTPSHDSFHT